MTNKFDNVVDINVRVKNAVQYSMYIYCKKLQYGQIRIGLEAAFQHEFAIILKNVLDLNTWYKNEKFYLTLEENFKLNCKDNYVDIVINYENNGNTFKYLIELKFKKISDSAPDLGTVETYFDLYKLDRLHNSKYYKGIINGGYSIFLTNLKTYSNKSRKGSRKDLPMYDGADISSKKIYITKTKTIRNKINKKYGKKFKGFKFSKDMTFNYSNFKIGKEDYWFFIQEL